MAEDRRTRVVFYTSEAALGSELFLYLYAHVAELPLDVRVVAVRTAPNATHARVARGWKKIRRIGFVQAAELLSSFYWQRRFVRRDLEEIEQRLRALPKPQAFPKPVDVTYAPSVNGPEAVAALRALSPDIVIQAGAGILRRPIIAIPRLAVLNLHHGIAPLIRGMNSIYWGLWERRPEWIGSTVHCIDEGLDTGKPLAYCHLDARPGEGFASLFVRATEGGAANLVRVVSQLSRGERVEVPIPPGESVYRSTISGWRKLLLERRLRRERAA